MGDTRAPSLSKGPTAKTMPSSPFMAAALPSLDRCDDLGHEADDGRNGPLLRLAPRVHALFPPPPAPHSSTGGPPSLARLPNFWPPGRWKYGCCDLAPQADFGPSLTLLLGLKLSVRADQN